MHPVGAPCHSRDAVVVSASPRPSGTKQVAFPGGGPVRRRDRKTHTVKVPSSADLKMVVVLSAQKRRPAPRRHQHTT